MLRRVSPWSKSILEQAKKGFDSRGVLIVGSVGSLTSECAKEIHVATGGGSFERVNCTPDSRTLQLQLFGPTTGIDVEYPFDSGAPNTAIVRAIDGTLYLDGIDRCNPADVDWLRLLLAQQPVDVNGRAVELDPNTRIVASVTPSWRGTMEYAIPQWLRSVFEGRIVVLEPLGTRANDILEAIEWFSWQATSDIPVGISWAEDAKELLLHRQWPGGYEELWDVVRSAIEISAEGVITRDACERVLSRHEIPGMRPVDVKRRQECQNYAHGMTYMGRAISASEIYSWIDQLSLVSSDRRFDPWLTGLRIVREISSRYYYSADRLRQLIRDAYLALLTELAAYGYMSERQLAIGASLPDLRALLVNPLGPIKSAAAVLPHMAHLLGAGRRQEVVHFEEVADRLAGDDRIRLVLFCDDFTGTGEQILKQLVEPLAQDSVLRRVCEKRSAGGKPVALGIVLGVGFGEALTRIRTSAPKWLPVLAHAGEEIGDEGRAFSNTSSAFPEPELRTWSKAIVVDEVGSSLLPSWPGGFGDLQALVVTADNVPNDTLPAIWSSGVVQGMPWRALFERASSPTS